MTYSHRRISLLLPLLLAAASVLLAWVVVSSPAVALELGPLLLLMLGVLAVVAVILLGPTACLAGILAFTIAGGSVHALGTIGAVDLRVSDVLYVALVVWWVMRVAQRWEHGDSERTGELRFRQAPALIFFAWTGLTLLMPSVARAGEFDATLVSWLSFMQTVSLAWLATTFIRSERELRLLLSVVALATVGAIVPAIVEGGFAEREAGILDPTALGLVSGLLVLMAYFGPITRNPVLRLLAALIGVAGLAQAGSVGALVGTSVALVTGATLARLATRPERAGPGRAGFRVVAIVAALSAGGAAAVVATELVRPEQLPYAQEFRGSSAFNRVILGSAGLEIAADNPLLGVGWRQSSNPKVIGAPDVGEQLRSRFPYAKPVFYPDVSPSSVHNAYIQIAAEFGLLGLALFAFALVSVGRSIRRVLARVDPRTGTGRLAWYMAFGLLLVLVWLNDNPLFGGQVETVIPALFVGGLAALGRMLERDG